MVFQPFFRVKNGLDFFPLDVEERQRLDGGGFVHSGYASDQIANVSHLFYGHGVLVFGHRKHAEAVGSVLAG